MRTEVTNLEASVKRLIDEKVKDLSTELDQFNILVVQELERCKNIVLEYVKDAPSTTAAAATTVASVGGVTSASALSATKREALMLPQFSGKEKTAFLQYPIWKKQFGKSHCGVREQIYSNHAVESPR